MNEEMKRLFSIINFLINFLSWISKDFMLAMVKIMMNIVLFLFDQFSKLNIKRFYVSDGKNNDEYTFVLRKDNSKTISHLWNYLWILK